MLTRRAATITLTLTVLIVFTVLTGRGEAQERRGRAFATPEEAATDPDFAVQGEYLHPVTGDGAQVIALGSGNFRAVMYPGGLPGYGWNGESKDAREGDTAAIGELLSESTRIHRRSPTLGAQPPGNAIVLFDGTQESLQRNWREGAQMTDDGLLMHVGNPTTSETFGDFAIHLEFRLPYMPAARGQQRANSGLYYQGRYETQILDSFGLEGLNNEAGGLYELKDPDVNTCLPPLVWQTYDGVFTAARFDDAGNKTSPARLTVRLNGVVVHDDVELPGPTPGNILEDTAEPGPVLLQDHGNPVVFRNIWIVPR